VGAPKWITLQIILWGLIALFQAFITNQSSYYATRFLLGMFEAGFIPGAQFMLGTFYKRQELAIRTSIFYIGNYFAAGTGSLMAAGILKLDGKCSLAGWQWLFIRKAIYTIMPFTSPFTPLFLQLSLIRSLQLMALSQSS